MTFFHIKPLVSGYFPPFVSRLTNFYTNVRDHITAEDSSVSVSAAEYTEYIIGVAELLLF